MRGSLAAGLGRAAYTLLVAVQVALLTRALTIGEYGIWASIAVVGSLAMVAAGMGVQLCNELSRDGERRQGEKRELFLAAFSLLLWFGMAAVAALALLQGLLPWELLLNGSDPRLFALARQAFLACLAVQLLALPLMLVSFAFRAFHENGLIAILGPASTAGCLLLLLVFLRAGASGQVYLAPFLAWTLVNGVSLLLFLRRRGWSFRLLAPRQCWVLFSPLLRKSALFSVFGWTFALLTLNLPYFAGLARGFDSAGRLDLYFKLYLALLAGIADMVQPLWPAYSSHLSRREFAWVRRSLGTSLAGTALLALAGGLLLPLLAPPLVRWVTGRTIVIDDATFLMLGIWLLLCAAAHALQVFLNARNVVRPQLAAALAVLLPMPLLSRRVGATGGTAGVILLNILGVAVVLAIMARKTLQEMAAARTASIGPMTTPSGFACHRGSGTLPKP